MRPPELLRQPERGVRHPNGRNAKAALPVLQDRGAVEQGTTVRRSRLAKEEREAIGTMQTLSYDLKIACLQWYDHEIKALRAQMGDV